MKKYTKYKNTNIEWLDQIPEHWDAMKLKRLSINVITGKTPSSENQVYFTPEFNWFTPGDFKEVKVSSSKRKISNIAVKECNMNVFSKHSVMLVSIGATLGKISLSLEEGTSNQQINTIVFDETLMTPLYGFYYLISKKEMIKQMSNASTLAILNQSQTNELIFAVPPQSEQKAIAEYLDKKTSEIDQIIDAKKKLIALYNEEKSALINRAVTKGIDDKAKLKPSGVEWLGDIPQHWEVKKLKFVAVVNQDSLPDSTDKELIINYVEISDVKYGNGIINQTEYRFEDAPSRAKRIVKDGDIIISTVRTYLKSIAVISNPLKNMIVSTGFAVITPVNISSAYLGFIANSNKFVAVIISLSVGVSYPAINPDGIMNINIPLPPLKEQEKIVDYIEKNVSVIDKKIANAKRLIELMSEYRTTLISEVVTGKVKVV